MPLPLKAIDTEYKGRRFRSRGEARWAIFFDELGLEWEYEVEGFELPSGTRYLPDFKLTRKHGGEFWVEVKPRVTKTEPKFEEFLSQVDYCAQLVSGTPLEFLENGGVVCPRCGVPRFESFEGHPTMHQDQVQCIQCDWECCSKYDYCPPEDGDWKKKLVYDGITSVPYLPWKGSMELTNFWFPAFAGHIRRAAERAQKARFEHGARP